MSCFFPVKGFRSRILNSNGKRPIVFNRKDGFEDMPVELSCGRCVGCRLNRSRVWAIRCLHEASLYHKNCFITLTYAPEHLPKDGSLDVSHFQKFMKRLRFKYPNDIIRFFHCGEYGGKLGRPHYHAILFNFDFDDKKLFKGKDLYTSAKLQALWPFGFSTVGSCTFDSAAYVARYVLKKVTGEDAFEHYSKIDLNSGEVIGSLKPEYVTMSRRPGIGKGWYDKYKSDVFPRDEVISRGRRVKPPKYYDSLYEIEDSVEFEDVKRRRVAKAKLREDDNTPDRLEVRRIVVEKNLAFKKRKLDGDV